MVADSEDGVLCRCWLLHWYWTEFIQEKVKDRRIFLLVCWTCGVSTRSLCKYENIIWQLNIEIIFSQITEWLLTTRWDKTVLLELVFLALLLITNFLLYLGAVRRSSTELLAWFVGHITALIVQIIFIVYYIIVLFVIVTPQSQVSDNFFYNNRKPLKTIIQYSNKW